MRCLKCLEGCSGPRGDIAAPVSSCCSGQQHRSDWETDFAAFARQFGLVLGVLSFDWWLWLLVLCSGNDVGGHFANIVGGKNRIEQSVAAGRSAAERSEAAAAAERKVAGSRLAAHLSSRAGHPYLVWFSRLYCGPGCSIFSDASGQTEMAGKVATGFGQSGG